MQPSDVHIEKKTKPVIFRAGAAILNTLGLSPSAPVTLLGGMVFSRLHLYSLIRYVYRQFFSATSDSPPISHK